jgi:signal transduction histidine kinase
MKEFLHHNLYFFRKYYPPFRNWHFWTVQLLAIPIALIHFVVVNADYFVKFQGLYFIPITLLVIPVIYAALTFGFAGAIGTAIWVVILSIPNLVFGLAGLERWGEIFQLAILVTLAIFIGQRVDREIKSRSKIESTLSALTASEKEYRGLFDSSPFPIIILDANKIIIDANPAAGVLLNKPTIVLKGTKVDQLGIKNVLKTPLNYQKENWWETNLVMITKEGSDIYLEPTYTRLDNKKGNVITQILLRDVTESYQKQAGLKAYTAHMLKAQEEERQHIARELHDETIQTLALLYRQLDKISDAKEKLPEYIVERLNEARDIAEKAVKDLRNITRGLRPPILDDLGVVASVRRLLVDFTDRSGINGQVKIVGVERRLPSDEEIGLYRITQETLWNIEHHAEAKNVMVTFTFSEKETILELSDDGIGFNVPAVINSSSKSHKLGLVGMQERTSLIGGELKINSIPGKGTTISVTIPSIKIADSIEYK